MTLKSERIKLNDGMYLNLVKTDKFKSNLLSYYFIRPLNREEVSKNALLPLVLRSGTEKFPTKFDISRKLEELYGSDLSISVNKRGEKQVIRFTMEWARGDQLDKKGHDYEVIDVLRGMIFEPLVKNQAFNPKHVKREKENLENIIRSRINNKRSHARQRCIEEMCKNERYSIYKFGYIEDLPEIDEINLYEHYQEIVKTSPIEVFYVGNYDEKLIEYLKEDSEINRGDIISIPQDTIIKLPQTKRIIKEELDINQGKVVLGYRAGIQYDDELYNALIVANDILGGGPNSKLFRNVREKESLAYYINSVIYKYKSLLLIDGGIEFKDFDKTVDITKEQLEDLKKGLFTQEDMDISIKSLKSSTESVKDSIFLISEFFFSRFLSKDNKTLEQIVKEYGEVTKDQIVDAANQITIDTIYFMDRIKE